MGALISETNFSTDQETWRVRLRTDDPRGRVLGAGVLLRDGLVLTCAHVIRIAGTDQHQPSVVVEFPGSGGAGSAGLRATVVPGHWVPRADDHTGDLALLRIAGPPPVASYATLHRLPTLWNHRIHFAGYPSRLTGGKWAEALIKGPGGPGDEWVQIDPVTEADTIIRRFSGAGVVDNRTGHVIGIVVSKLESDREGAHHRHGYMIPTGTIVKHLGRLREAEPGHYIGGRPPLPPGFPGEPGGPASAPLAPDRGFARWLTRWLAAEDDMADVEITFVRHEDAEADFALRTTLTRADRERSPRTSRPSYDDHDDTGPAPRAGSIDLALVVRDKTPAQVAEEIAEGMGLDGPGPLPPSARVAAGALPLTTVVCGVDEAARPVETVELLHTLVRRGGRLLLVFRQLGSPALRRTHELLLDPACPRRWLERVGRRIAVLARTEEDARDLRRRAASCVGPLPRPPRYAPDLELKAARLEADPQQGTTGFLVKLSYVERTAETALLEAETAHRLLARQLARHQELRGLLDGYQARLAAHGITEAAASVHQDAQRLLTGGPCEPAVAEAAVDRFVREARTALEAHPGTGTEEGP
ncbi:serine protease [Streptomyces enissocaesilis]|uniref:Serine protease n=1 Tax=Streptomyces enissocaesilis TaxID=332589 RepID=A0ABN3XF72_9ACTN